MLQQLIVLTLVAGSLAYVVWTLMPAAWRARIAGRPVAASGCGSCAECPSGRRGTGSAGPLASPPWGGGAAGAPGGGQEIQVRFFPVRLASYKASSARSSASSSASPGR